MMIGTDYNQADQSAEIQALGVIEQRGEIPAAVVCQFFADHPRGFCAAIGDLRERPHSS
jgi:hypothetical protein